jgi:hypothetical protein
LHFRSCENSRGSCEFSRVNLYAVTRDRELQLPPQADIRPFAKGEDGIEEPALQSSLFCIQKRCPPGEIASMVYVLARLGTWRGICVD